MYEPERRDLAEFCHILYERNLVAATDGNVSVRLPDGNILLTPSGKNKGFVKAQDMLALNMDGLVWEGQGKPSREYPMHRVIYEKRKDVCAVIHTHPVYATAFAVAGKIPPENYLIENRMVLKKIALAGYAAPGTVQMVHVIEPYLQEYSIILLQNHGALTMGKNLEDAFNKMETLENTAKTILMSRLAGNPMLIAPEELDKIGK